jgi:uncharacterized protein involved in exopolysaccharide biosynthesis
MPSSYTSQALLATGLVDETQHTLSVEGITFQESQISQQFTNIIEMMKLRKNIQKVSYLLILHDITSPRPYKKWSKDLSSLNDADRNKAIACFRDHYTKGTELNVYDPSENYDVQILKSMKYDEQSLLGSLSITRKNYSDYIQVEFASENPDLSAFVANTLCQEFVKGYESIISSNKMKKNDYLADLLKKKYAAMNEKIALLRNYKIENKILNLYEQSKILYTNMMVVDGRRSDAKKEIESYTGALNSIDSKFNPKDRRYLEGALTRLNQDILLTKSSLYGISDKYIESEYGNTYKLKKDSLTRKLNEQISSLNDKYIYDPMNTKKDLMGQKLTLEVERDVAQNSLNGLTRQLNDYSGRFNRLVPFEAIIQAYERDIDIASREYLDILNRYNQLGVNPDDPIKLSQVAMAVPGTGMPTKKIIFVLAAGIISVVLCVLVLFVVFFFNNSISSPDELVKKTKLPVLGNLQKLSGTTVDMQQLWQDKSGQPELAAQRELLRSLRYEVLKEMGNNKVLCLTALHPRQGTSFTALNLAYAFSTMHKRVLLVDGNFRNPSVSEIMPPAISIEGLFGNSFAPTEDAFITAGSLAETRSPFEIANQQQISLVLQNLPFDIVLIDTGALSNDNNTKEWIACSDKVVCVFENGQPFTAADEASTDWLQQDGKLTGWVFNKYSKA